MSWKAKKLFLAKALRRRGRTQRMRCVRARSDVRERINHETHEKDERVDKN
ncbi:hypothetical protein PLANPX_0504 [Lacipirellula parvula]|uniref:Uncharacterized protein n=1 Tax=Lacipirellula parvula TaxID=2650471 RepID=A0A5K7X4Z4_9BACT|nr:hypothetical protein PLANPX_0504 [Lacipirellula parvula]